MRISKRIRDEFRELGKIGGKRSLETMTDAARVERARKAGNASAKARGCACEEPDLMQVPEALWNLRVVAKQWLLEHPDHPEAPAIRKALERTKDLV